MSWDITRSKEQDKIGIRSMPSVILISNAMETCHIGRGIVKSGYSKRRQNQDAVSAYDDLDHKISCTWHRG